MCSLGYLWCEYERQSPGYSSHLCEKHRREFELEIERLARQIIKGVNGMKVHTCSKTNKDNPYMSIWNMNYTHKDKNKDWVFVSRRESPQPVTGQIKVPDAVLIAAIIDNKLVVTKELRPPLGGYLYSLPAGTVEKGETAEEVVRRELQEETGLVVDGIDKVSPILYSSAGFTDESIQIFFVTCHGTITNEFQEEYEDIETMLLDKDEITDLLDSKGKFENVMIGARSWPVFAMYRTIQAMYEEEE